MKRLGVVAVLFALGGVVGCSEKAPAPVPAEPTVLMQTDQEMLAASSKNPENATQLYVNNLLGGWERTCYSMTAKAAQEAVGLMVGQGWLPEGASCADYASTFSAMLGAKMKPGTAPVPFPRFRVDETRHTPADAVVFVVYDLREPRTLMVVPGKNGFDAKVFGPGKLILEEHLVYEDDYWKINSGVPSVTFKPAGG